MSGAGPPHRGESAALGEGPAAALRGILCRRKSAQMQELWRHSPRQETAGGMGEALMAPHPIRYFSTAFLSHTCLFPGRRGATALSSSIARVPATIVRPNV